MRTFDPYCLQAVIDTPVDRLSIEAYETAAKTKSLKQNRRELLWVSIHGLILTRSVLFLVNMVFFMWIPLLIILLTGLPLLKLTVFAVIFPIYHYLVIERVYLMSKDKINKTQMILKAHRRSLLKVITEQTIKQ